MKLGTISTVSTVGTTVVVIVDGSFQRGARSTRPALLTVRSVICLQYMNEACRTLAVAAQTGPAIGRPAMKETL
jgi:hypothetical protein